MSTPESAATAAAAPAGAPFGVVSVLLITMLAVDVAGAGAVSDDVKANYCKDERQREEERERELVNMVVFRIVCTHVVGGKGRVQTPLHSSIKRSIKWAIN